MRGYVVQRGGRYYAVIYEGRDPLSGKEQRRWHPAGTNPAAAKDLARELAEAQTKDRPSRSSLTVAIYLTQRWLPSKRVTLRLSTFDAYQRMIALHVLPYLGRVPLRHLRPDHLERLYAELGANGLGNKTLVEIHMVLRRSLEDARLRGLITHNPAAVAHAPKRRPLESATSRSWTADQLKAFLDFASSSRHFAALWLVANTGMRRGELLGLRWSDVDRWREALGHSFAHLGRLRAARVTGQVTHGTTHDRSRRKDHRDTPLLARTSTERECGA